MGSHLHGLSGIPQESLLGSSLFQIFGYLSELLILCRLCCLLITFKFFSVIRNDDGAKTLQNDVNIII